MLDGLARLVAGDPDLPFAAPTEHAILRDRELEGDMRPALGLARQIGGEAASGRHFHQTRLNRNACLAQHSDAIAAHARIRIGDGNDHTADTGGNQRVHARRRLAEMGTGFERDIGCGAARPFASCRQRLRFSVRAARFRGNAAPDNCTVADDDAADGGVCAGLPQMRRAQGNRFRHEILISGMACGRHVNDPRDHERSWHSLRTEPA